MRKAVSVISVFAAATIAVASSISCCAKTFLDDDAPHYDVQWNQLIDQVRFAADAQAQPLLKSALAVTKHFASPDIREAATLRALAKNLSRQGQHATAIDLLNRSAQISSLLNSNSNTYAVTTASDLASEYTQVDRFDRAKTILETTLPSVKRLEGSDSADYAQINEALGQVYFQLHDYERAEKCFVQATRSFKQANANEADIAGALNLAGITSMFRPMRKTDESFLLDLIKANRELHFPDNGCEFVRLGSFYLRTGQTAKAKVALQTAIKLFGDQRGVCGGSGSEGFSCGPYETLDDRLADLFKPEGDFNTNFILGDPANEKLAKKLLGELKQCVRSRLEACAPSAKRKP